MSALRADVRDTLNRYRDAVEARVRISDGCGRHALRDAALHESHARAQLETVLLLALEEPAPTRPARTAEPAPIACADCGATWNLEARPAPIGPVCLDVNACLRRTARRDGRPS